MTQEFKPKGRSLDRELGEKVATRYEERQQSFIHGLETAVNVLPIAAPQNIESVTPFAQHYGETCFIAAAVATSSQPTENAQKAEAHLRSVLTEKTYSINLEF